MSEKIAARTIADMQVAADRHLNARIWRLKAVCAVLAVIILGLGALLLQPLVSSYSDSPPISVPSQGEATVQPDSILTATLTGRRITVNSPEYVLLYARADIADMKNTPSATLRWYFLYTSDPGGAEYLSVGPQTYFAAEADGEGRLHGTSSANVPYPIISLSNACNPTTYAPSCATVFGAPHPNPAKLVLTGKDNNGIYVVGITDVPALAESCTQVLGGACNE